jgi:hypothetical protein
MSTIKSLEKDKCNINGCNGWGPEPFILLLVALVIVLSLFGEAH